MLYETESYKLLLGDNRKIVKELTDESIGLSVFSPPYFGVQEINYDTAEGNIEYSATWDLYCLSLRDLIESLYDKLVPGGRLCINIDDKYQAQTKGRGNICLHTHARLIEYAYARGYDYKGNIMWRKIRNANASGGSGMMFGTYPHPAEIPIVTQYEYILVFRKPGKREVPAEIREASIVPKSIFASLAEGIWNINGVSDKEHPAVFPPQIPSRLINLFSFVGDIVLDPFCGVGTTGVSALTLNRKFLGIDISKKYLEVANERLSRPVMVLESPNIKGRNVKLIN